MGGMERALSASQPTLSTGKNVVLKSLGLAATKILFIIGGNVIGQGTNNQTAGTGQVG
jgi:hypothetical protein